MSELTDVLLVSPKHDWVPSVDARNAPQIPSVTPLVLRQACDTKIAAFVRAQKLTRLLAPGNEVMRKGFPWVSNDGIERLIHAMEAHFKSDQDDQYILGQLSRERTVKRAGNQSDKEGQDQEHVMPAGDASHGLKCDSQEGSYQ